MPLNLQLHDDFESHQRALAESQRIKRFCEANSRRPHAVAREPIPLGLTLWSLAQ